MIVDPMFMIIQNSRSFLTAVTPTAVAPTVVLLANLGDLPELNSNLPEFTLIHLTLSEFTGIYLSLPDFTLIYLNLPEFT